MIDWITAILRCTHDHTKLFAGRVASINAAGEVEWTVEKDKDVEGSHSSNIKIRSMTDRTIRITGNPAKFLQGHNIFGTDDLIYLMGLFFDSLIKIDSLGLSPTSDEYEDIQHGDYRLSRVDINQSWHLKDKASVLSWIRSAGQCARLKRRGAGQFAVDTLYFGKKSRRWAVKCYSKGHEINAKGHKLHPDLQIPELLEWADKSLRIEMVIRSMALKEFGLDHAKVWTKDTAKVLLCSHVLSNLELSDNMPIPDDVLSSLPVRLKGFYSLWLSGEDLRAQMTKPTFYRYRKVFLAYGIDIALVQESTKSNVIPLVRYLEATPADIPQWAYDKGLVA
jgi:II/X family phage/plasmid replication protein